MYVGSAVQRETLAGGQATRDFTRAWLSHHAIVDLDPAEAETDWQRCRPRPMRLELLRLDEIEFALLDVESLKVAVASKASMIAGASRVSHRLRPQAGCRCSLQKGSPSATGLTFCLTFCLLLFASSPHYVMLVNYETRRECEGLRRLKLNAARACMEWRRQAGRQADLWQPCEVGNWRP